MLRYEPFIFGGQLLRTEALTSSIELGLSSERRTREWATFVSMITLLASDLSAVIGAAGFGYLIWADNVLPQPLSDYLELLPLLVLFPAVYASAGLYPGFGLGAVETLRRIFYGTFL